MNCQQPLVLDKVFNELNLHRIEANIQPENQSSIQLVKSNGFRYEGFSPRYLKINNQWCGHEQGGLLYDKITSFVIDMQKLGTQLNSSQATYTLAMNKLHEGKGNILAKTQQLQTLGAKASKNLLKVAPQAFGESDEEEKEDGGEISTQPNDSKDTDLT